MQAILSNSSEVRFITIFSVNGESFRVLYLMVAKLISRSPRKKGQSWFPVILISSIKRFLFAIGKFVGLMRAQLSGASEAGRFEN